MAQTKLNPVAYVDSLDVDLPSTGRRLRQRTVGVAPGAITADQKDAGYVCDGSLVSFVANVSGQARQDVLNSTLLAQLAANKAADRFSDITNWYKKYVEVLENVGWVVQSFDFTRYQASGTTVTMDKVVVDLLAAIASDNEMAVVQQTQAALKALSNDDGKLVLFDTSSQSLDQGNFQVGVASETNGALAFSTAAMHFQAQETTTRFLWWGYSSSSIDLFKSAQNMTLNDQVYAGVRNKVLQKLGQKIEQYVDDLDI